MEASACPSLKAPESAAKATAALLYGSPLHVGGVETHLLSLLRHGGGVDWHIIAAASDEFSAQAAACGARIHDWKPDHALDVRGTARLARLLRRCGADLVHIHSPRATLPGAAAARWLGIPSVVTVHLPSYHPIQGEGFRPRLRRSLYRSVERFVNHRLVNRLIYVSRRIHEEAIALGVAPRENSCFIANGIEARRAEAATPSLREALGTPADALVACCVGRLDAQKGLDLLLDALARIPARAGLRLWLAGDGPCRSDLAAQAKRLGLESIVQFLGFRNDVPRLLEACDLFVLPSRYEAQSIALLEAMSAGLPCIVSDVGDNADLISGGAGRVVPPEDAGALASALTLLLDDPALRRNLGTAARRKSAEFGAERMVERTLQVYGEAMGDR